MICDLAETYQIYDYKTLPVSKLAVLVFGLRNSSRIKMKMSNKIYYDDVMLLANLNDLVRNAFSKKKSKPGISYLDIYSFQEPKENDIKAYDSAEAFELARLKLIKEVTNGN